MLLKSQAQRRRADNMAVLENLYLARYEGFMKKIAVLYHSGVGNTKKVSEKISVQLGKHYETEIYSVEKLPEDFDLDNYIGLVIGFPVIHTHPSTRILKFIDSINALPKPKAAYIFATCGWYSANTLRIFSKRCVAKNIIPIMNRVYNGCPATDGTLLAPFIKRLFRFPKNLDNIIADDISTFSEKMKNGVITLNEPTFKLYSILNYPNKLAGHFITFRIYLHKHKCSKCNNCINNCPSGAFEKSADSYPIFHFIKCEKCYRCIHHCPNLALSLSKRKTPRKVLGNK